MIKIDDYEISGDEFYIGTARECYSLWKNLFDRKIAYPFPKPGSDLDELRYLKVLDSSSVHGIGITYDTSYNIPIMYIASDQQVANLMYDQLDRINKVANKAKMKISNLEFKFGKAI